MLAGISGFNATFLADLNATQSRITQLNKQITSTLRVSQASDDPAAIASILETQSDIDRATQTQTNLQQASIVASSADGALASAASLLDQLRSLAAQGANSTATAATRATLSEQVKAIEQQLVSIANTQVQGRYIFAGDDPAAQPYILSAPAANLNNPAALFDIGNPLTDSESFSVTYTDTSNVVQNQIVSVAATATGITGAAFVSQLNTALTTAGVTGVTARIGADGTLQLTGNNLLSAIHTLTPGVTQGVAANNASLTEGVIQNNTAANTTTIANAGGSSILPGMTAQQIFDARNPDGTPAAGNILRVVHALGQALQNSDQPGIQAAALALPAAVTRLGQATTHYGNTQSWLAQAVDDASSKLVNLHQVLGSLRDTDIAQAATDLTLANTAMQAALAAHGSLNVRSLFDYLG
ncbi:MAG TPA: flagellar hook-associated protein FlgL [Bryobacteraceae bacterium]|nr:flagellar hook-associated protein FlgL [Bryobacteraceae bacterium]